jgi:hypothetical protein
MCTELENILLEVRHLHARHYFQSGAFAPVIKFDSDSVFEAAPTRQMCARMGVGVQLSAPYAHHMLGKAERSWRTIRDNATAMLHSMAVPNSMWSCVVTTVVYLRNRTYNRSVGLTGGVPLTLLPSSARPTPPNFAYSDAPSSPRCPTSCVVNLAKKRSGASWLATHLTPMATVSTIRRSAA